MHPFNKYHNYWFSLDEKQQLESQKNDRKHNPIDKIKLNHD
jgi:hypothetical protein